MPAGKGGCIKRLSSPLDARGYAALPIASPTPEEKKRHFLWRFYARLPKSGHIAIFDRTWYGRVLVSGLRAFAARRIGSAPTGNSMTLNPTSQRAAPLWSNSGSTSARTNS